MKYASQIPRETIARLEAMAAEDPVHFCQPHPCPGVYSSREDEEFWCYKCWGHALEQPMPGSNLAEFFRQQDLQFLLPAGFREERRITVSHGSDCMAVDCICDAYTPHLFDSIADFYLTTDLPTANLESTVKRLRNHPSLAYYVSSNESTEVVGAKDLIMKLDGTRGYQMQSECDGVHDGSPYKQVNPMQHYENTASPRGSRVDGFNPEYGAPTLPTLETLREVMDEKDLWPINKEVWDYHDGGGFHLMSTMYKDLVNNYGTSQSIEEFAKKGQLVGAMNSKTIWEVWNYNKLDYGDRYCSGLLFWYHNCPVRQVCARMWDWSLEPTASLYHTQNALEPLHAQFDYLKNMVSVCNDYYRSFKNYKVKADVYDLNSKKVFSYSQRIDIGEDEVLNDLFKIDFPSDITPVHFIRLGLSDEKGKEVASTFYWRSNAAYEGKEILTGPTSSGFESLNDMPTARLQTKYKTKEVDGRYYIEVSLKNTSSRIAFFTQLQFLDKAGKPVRPSFYTDNFFSLLPGETKQVLIDTSVDKVTEGEFSLTVGGWNVQQKKYKL